MTGRPDRGLLLLCALCAALSCATPGAAPEARAPDAPALAPQPEAESDGQRETLARALEERADAHADLGQRDLAAPLYARALEVRRGMPDSRAHTLAALAVIQHDRGRLAEAEHFYDRSLEALEQSGAEDRPLRIRVLANHGSLLRADGRPEAGRTLLAEALALAEAPPAEETTGLAWLLGELAADESALGESDVAAGHLERALSVWERYRPESEPLVAETLANLAVVQRARGQSESALAALERAIPLYRRALDPADPTLARAIALRAETALQVAARLTEAGERAGRAGDEATALASFERALALREDVLAPGDPDLAYTLAVVGATRLARGDAAGARAPLERAVAIQEEGVGDAVALGTSLSYLGRAYAGVGENAQAQRTLEHALALMEPALGKLDPLTLETRATWMNLRAPDAVPAAPAP